MPAGRLLVSSDSSLSLHFPGSDAGITWTVPASQIRRDRPTAQHTDPGPVGWPQGVGAPCPISHCQPGRALRQQPRQRAEPSAVGEHPPCHTQDVGLSMEGAQGARETVLTPAENTPGTAWRSPLEAERGMVHLKPCFPLSQTRLIQTVKE